MNSKLIEKKYLVTSGCSFTEGHHMGKLGSWAYYLSQITNLDLRNVAKGGAGNEYIADSIITYLYNNKEVRENCIVIVAWSEITRLTSSIIDDEGSYTLDTVRPFDFLSDGKYKDLNGAERFFSSIPHCVYKTYLSIIKLNHFLEYYNIPYFYIDAINDTKVKFISGDDETIELCTYYDNADCVNVSLSGPDEYRYVINKTTTDKIFNNFLKLGKYKTMLEYIFSDYEKYEKGNSGHPNDIASREIAEIIYNQVWR